MILSTHPITTDNQHVDVLWRTGQQHGGKLSFKLPQPSDCATLIAELCAIRYLMIVRKVFNVLPMAGRGYCLHVSTGAIRKLILGTSTKKEAQPYALFFRPRFDDIEIKVVRSKDDDFQLAFDPSKHELVEWNADYFTSPYDVIDTPAIGQIYLTNHAVEQYVKRCPAETIAKPWKSLVQRLQHEELRQLPIPESVLKHKARKYGENNAIEAWGHEHSLFTYLISVSEGKRTVVTVFRRQPN